MDLSLNQLSFTLRGLDLVESRSSHINFLIVPLRFDSTTKCSAQGIAAANAASVLLSGPIWLLGNNSELMCSGPLMRKLQGQRLPTCPAAFGDPLHVCCYIIIMLWVMCLAAAAWLQCYRRDMRAQQA
jgi:hypothetical protein